MTGGLSFTSFAFFGFVLVFALVAQLLPARARLGVILGANTLFVASYVPSLLALVPLLAFIAIGYLAIVSVSCAAPRKWSGLLIAAIIGLFIWLKHYPFVAGLPRLPFVYITVGLSYILFRILHLAFEVGDGALARPRFVHYLAYLFYFPAFLSGPIHRYEPFARDLASPESMDAESAFATLYRLLIGYAKVTIFGELVLMPQRQMMAALVHGGGSAAVMSAEFAIGAGLYLIFLFANFSGYTDMAIAISRLFGIILPENFNRPFTATNFQDFWSRWHITLSDWFKIYFFNPLLKTLMRRFPSARLAPYLGVAAMFIVFVVLGAWHGASWEFMLTGVLLGFGIAANKLYQIEMTRHFGKKRYQGWTKRWLYIWGARGLTMAWVSFALIPFWLSVSEIAALLRHIGFLGWLGALAVMTLAFASGLFGLQWVIAQITVKRPSALRSATDLGRIAALAAMILLLLFAVPLVNSSSDFVYKAF